MFLILENWKMQGLRRALCSTAASSADLPPSFIAIAKKHGIAELVGKPFPVSDRFDRALRGLHIDSAENGRAVCSFRVEKELQNSYGTLHGGAISTIVDVMGTLALLSVDHTRGGVSVDLNVSFVAAARPNDALVATGIVLKTGKTLGFTEVQVRRADNGKLVATGRHTKAL